MIDGLVFVCYYNLHRLAVTATIWAVETILTIWCCWLTGLNYVAILNRGSAIERSKSKDKTKTRLVLIRDCNCYLYIMAFIAFDTLQGGIHVDCDVVDFHREGLLFLHS